MGESIRAAGPASTATAVPASVVDLRAARVDTLTAEPGIRDPGFKKAVPQSVKGVSAGAMTEVAAAGVELPKIMPAIIAGSIVLLGAYLAWIDWLNAKSLEASYSRFLSQASVGHGFSDVARIDGLIALLRKLNATPDYVVGDQERDDAIELAQRLQQVARQKTPPRMPTGCAP